MALDDRIPQMTETELANLRDNALRLTQSGGPQQKAEAERLLPLIATALASLKVAKSEALQKQKLERKEAATATRKRRAATAKAEAEAKAEAD